MALPQKGCTAFMLSSPARFLALLLSFVVVMGKPGFAEEAKTAVSIVPHRAVYKVGLSHVNRNSPVQDVRGTMIYDLSDTCDGWAIQQQLKLHYIFSEEEEMDVYTTSVTWEAKDGSFYRFNTKSESDGQQEEAIRGSVSKKDGQLIAHFLSPQDVPDRPLTPDEIFPTHHTLMVIEKALAGEKFFTRRVFDGADERGDADASAFIGAMVQPDPKKNWGEGVKDKSLVAHPSWAVRFAYYKPDQTDGAPDYEMEMVLLQNGIAPVMTLDYGDFAIRGELVALESGETLPCGKVNHKEQEKE